VNALKNLLPLTREDRSPYTVRDKDENIVFEVDATYIIAEDSEIAAEIVRRVNAIDDLLAACEEFVRKCECGEARSTRSYAQMKAAIAKAKGTDHV
jgi:hypothetical protein